MPLVFITQAKDLGDWGVQPVLSPAPGAKKRRWVAGRCVRGSKYELIPETPKSEWRAPRQRNGAHVREDCPARLGPGHPAGEMRPVARSARHPSTRAWHRPSAHALPSQPEHAITPDKCDPGEGPPLHAALELPGSSLSGGWPHRRLVRTAQVQPRFDAHSRVVPRCSVRHSLFADMVSLNLSACVGS